MTRFNISAKLLSACLILIPTLSWTQNCFDADFESGTLGGYEAYHGSIDFDGTVSFHIPGISPEQHRIMKVSDGYDPIAEQLCDQNKNLLVTGSGTGKYTLRLGDVVNGARTSKVVLSFDVTPDVSFFLLKYAIVINDPNHPYEVQPRFELNIKDEDGNILDCGEYKVRAEANIDGFESCDDWRVRPWTTAGFELESYLGQRINIEILSTDCGYGGHGGYAYIDATCTPLELDLQSYCPGTGFARYVVTEGFDAYEWNTGETSRFLNIDNPIPGEEYSVTVTSSTGCTLVLTDTLPQLPSIDDLEPSFFDDPETIDVCFGEEVIYQPTGTNIDEVYAIELDYTSDVFHIFAEESQVINFVTLDNLGCLYDTTQLIINVEYLNVGIETVSTCEGLNVGEIIIDDYGDNTIRTALNNMDFQGIFHYKDLEPGTYILNITNASGCLVSKEVVVIESVPPELKDMFFIPANCDMDNGTIVMEAYGDDVEFSFNGGDFGPQSAWYNLSGGNYSIKYREGDEGCQKEEEIIINVYGPPQLFVNEVENTTCGWNNGEIHLQATNGYPPLEFSADGIEFTDTTSLTDLPIGEYLNVIVRDAGDCRDTTQASIEGEPFIQVDSMVITPTSCGEENGALDVILINPTVPYDLYVDTVTSSAIYEDQISSGEHALIFLDHNGCKFETTINVDAIPRPRIDSIGYLNQMCVNDRVKAVIHASSSENINLEYSVNNGFFGNKNVFDLVPDIYDFHVKDELACEVDTTIEFFPEDYFRMANIFSPDGDEVNDFFCYQVQNGVEFVNELIIYDRWGNNVYDLNGATNIITDVCWDGTFQGKDADSGVYVYYLEVQLADGRLLCKYGDVTIVRLE